MFTFIKTVISFLQDKNYRNLLMMTTAVIALGSITYHYLEGWSWVDCIYFCVITLTTIGYGDLSPITDAGKLFTIFYIVIGLGMILNFIQTVYNHYQDVRNIRNDKKSK
ncbi:potassium channel family protein [Portibacter lacus]|uniref:Potassium channel domain-containing protein n=1 Tax=Portibacter lacus TaxID=1099794 RepID=A0AA37SQN0_9BACT|nr:potassium channel family protein [Portibacter lacus]GLR18037.1 hypothetical protein GCM10007940_26520 [Portibacter lacus]